MDEQIRAAAGLGPPPAEEPDPIAQLERRLEDAERRQAIADHQAAELERQTAPPRVSFDGGARGAAPHRSTDPMDDAIRTARFGDAGRGAG